MDAKGRMFIPARLRDELGDAFYITKGLDNCLSIYSLGTWASIEEKISALPLSKSRGLQRTLFASAAYCELDSQGRALVPQKLRQYAGLVREVTVIGVSNRAEIWDSERWRKVELDDLTSENLAESMEELGF